MSPSHRCSSFTPSCEHCWQLLHQQALEWTVWLYLLHFCCGASWMSFFNLFLLYHSTVWLQQRTFMWLSNLPNPGEGDERLIKTLIWIVFVCMPTLILTSVSGTRCLMDFYFPPWVLSPVPFPPLAFLAESRSAEMDTPLTSVLHVYLTWVHSFHLSCDKHLQADIDLICLNVKHLSTLTGGTGALQTEYK